MYLLQKENRLRQGEAVREGQFQQLLCTHQRGYMYYCLCHVIAITILPTDVEILICIKNVEQLRVTIKTSDDKRETSSMSVAWFKVIKSFFSGTLKIYFVTRVQMLPSTSQPGWTWQFVFF